MHYVLSSLLAQGSLLCLQQIMSLSHVSPMKLRFDYHYPHNHHHHHRQNKDP